jgi:hypothetical protein
MSATAIDSIAPASLNASETEAGVQRELERCGESGISALVQA